MLEEDSFNPLNPGPGEQRILNIGNKKELQGQEESMQLRSSTRQSNQV